MQIFEVYQGIIALFSVTDEQKDAQAETVEPLDVERLTVARGIGNHQKLPAAGTVADGFHRRNVAEQVLAILLGDLFGFARNAAEDLDTGNDVVPVEPGLQRIFGTAEQNGAVALLGENAVEIVYPERDAAPGEED